MLHIIGLNHRAQARKPGAEFTEEQQTLAECLRHTIEGVRPAVIAEEDSEEALAKRGKASIVKEIADEKKIEHRFCNPTEKQRKAIGYRDGQSLELELFMNDAEGLTNDEIFCRARAIEIGRYFPIRERFWLEQLDGCRDAHVVFVCGDLHVESFGRLLDSNSI
jgi:hypothetical protein